VVVVVMMMVVVVVVVQFSGLTRFLPAMQRQHVSRIERGELQRAFAQTYHPSYCHQVERWSKILKGRALNKGIVGGM
jgi:hypothetical protein